MKKQFLNCLIIAILASFTSLAFATERRIAITIDDLPFVGEGKNLHLNKIIDVLEDYHIPATGFIIGETVAPSNWPVLTRFRNIGTLGNHTFTHPNLNKVDAQTYLEDIAKAEEKLAPLLSKPKYFRFPYLAMGDPEKKDIVLNYLASNHYHIAPITIDSKDFIFNQELLSVPEEERRDFFRELEPVYLDYIFLKTIDAETLNQQQHAQQRAQILLLHANLLNAYALSDVLQFFRKRGYRFVSLKEALKTFPKKLNHAKPKLALENIDTTNFDDKPSDRDKPTSVIPKLETARIDKAIEDYYIWD